MSERSRGLPASQFCRGVLALADEAIERDRHAGLGANMISLEDCVGLCGLTEEEVLAIAEHEHLPEIAATAIAAYLLSQNHGSEKVLDMIVDDIRQAQRLTGWTADEWASPSPPQNAETKIPQGVPCTRLANLILAGIQSKAAITLMSASRRQCLAAIGSCLLSVLIN